jgi:hypothetical protein
MAPEQLADLGLEWEQMSGAQRPYGRQRLNRPTKILLFALRAYTMLAIPVVIYAFVRSLQ